MVDVNASRISPVGVLLAAGQGRRMGQPKALLRTQDGASWLQLTRRRMLEAGCDDVLVVLGAAAESAKPLVEDGWATVATNWSEGMSASLRAALTEIDSHGFDCALVQLVDTPDIGSDAMRRVLGHGSRSVLARAVYEGTPGHPVLIGNEHWQSLRDFLRGDSGAKEYLHRHGCDLIECGDLATGRDIDTPDEFRTMLLG